MGRPPRVDVGGYCYHVLNRSVGKRTIFRKKADFIAFEHVLAEAVERSAGQVQLLAYCVMGTHWHLVVRTTSDGALSPFMKWLTLTHTQRYQVAHRSVGEGPLYQGRFKSFLIEEETHLLAVCRYVERNAARASLVKRAEDWKWSSLWRWRHPDHVDEFEPELQLSDWPISIGRKTRGNRPVQWLRTVNAPLSENELEALHRATKRSQPYGSAKWVEKVTARYGLESTLRQPGRPRLDDDE